MKVKHEADFLKDAELKPCPFCGGKARKKKFKSPRVRIVGYYVECSVCECKTNMSLACDEVIEAWNRRTHENR